MSEDEFERGYLVTDAVLHREKVASRSSFLIVAVMALTSAILAIGGLAAGAGGDFGGWAGGIFLLAVAAVLGVTSVVGTVLRTIVTEREIVLHAGIEHEVRIPLAGVKSIALRNYDAAARQRAMAEGRGSFVWMVPGKPLVRIEWVDAGGRDRAAWVGSEQPQVLVEVIERASAAARAALAPALAVRVAEDVAATEERSEADELEHDAPPRAKTRG
jgi:hypothetical protein